MACSYDFDIHWIFPKEVMDHPELAKMIGEIGFQANAGGNYKALFRDPVVAKTLRGANEAVRAVFEASGFGFASYDCGIGPGRYPAEDEEARRDALRRLSGNLARANLSEAEFNGFDVAEFFAQVSAAEPVTPEAPSSRASAVVDPSSNVDRALPKSIDDAFANPKAGKPVSRGGADTPTLDDLMVGSAPPSPRVTGPGQSDGQLADDLKYRPTLLQEAPKTGKALRLPLAIIGGLVFAYLLFGQLGVGGVSSIAQ